jgi:hypothetical protein
LILKDKIIEKTIKKNLAKEKEQKKNGAKIWQAKTQ